MIHGSLNELVNVALWKAAPAIVLAGVAGLLLGYPRRWFERKGSGQVQPVRSMSEGNSAPHPAPGNAGDAPDDVPRCPSCNGPMVKRPPRRGVNAGITFWRCANHPQCHGTRVV